ncbi:hypothetical protein [Sphingobacterium mizutaii]|uniref:hypothetical protein n=1 Tax=Sphingobacterium mizutaii TaxID=1010 RepID=UPI0012FD20E5|nr:hypothetical protein [Sphingobacterium mizutaii]
MSEESVRFSFNSSCHSVPQVQDLYANTIMLCIVPRSFLRQDDPNVVEGCTPIE